MGGYFLTVGLDTFFMGTLYVGTVKGILFDGGWGYFLTGCIVCRDSIMPMRWGILFNEGWGYFFTGYIVRRNSIRPMWRKQRRPAAKKQ